MGKWELIQENAIQILSDGMHELLRQPYKRFDSQIEGMPGNYLISLVVENVLFFLMNLIQ